jgi:threonine aldolase
VVGLSAMLRPYEAVLCAECAHIAVDECGAPERFLGAKLIDLPSSDGKLRPEQLAPHLVRLGDAHHVQPRVVSITQPTELGAVYTAAEVRALADFAHARGLLVHMDGARIANAAAALGREPAEFTRKAGVDVLSFGGTKNGMMYGEAILVFDPALAAACPFLRKQAMQLASKMRFIAAQFTALLSNDLWRSNAAHANAMARLLADRVRGIPGVRLTREPQANAVFAVIPHAAIPALQARSFFYVWDENTNEVRWMTSFDTTEEDVEAFAGVVREVLGR